MWNGHGRVEILTSQFGDNEDTKFQTQDKMYHCSDMFNLFKISSEALYWTSYHDLINICQEINVVELCKYYDFES